MIAITAAAILRPMHYMQNVSVRDIAATLPGVGGASVRVEHVPVGALVPTAAPDRRPTTFTAYVRREPGWRPSVWSHLHDILQGDQPSCAS